MCLFLLSCLYVLSVCVYLQHFQQWGSMNNFYFTGYLLHLGLGIISLAIIEKYITYCQLFKRKKIIIEFSKSFHDNFSLKDLTDFLSGRKSRNKSLSMEIIRAIL